MGDHGRLSFDHVAAKKSRGYYCPPVRVSLLNLILPCDLCESI